MRSPTARTSDQALLDGFAAGDADSSAAFVRQFQSRVYGVAINLLGERDSAEGVAHDAFVRAWKHASAYDPERGSVAVWLMRTTRSLAFDSLRRRRPRRLDTDIVRAVPPVAAETLVDDVAIPDRTAQVRAAFARLPPGHAKALWLAAFYGHTAQQIAASERIPLDTAKAWIRQGMRTFQAEITEPGTAASRTAASRTAAPGTEPAPAPDLQGDLA
ncbi:MAG TPA: sigma-70 family RNA polymerase sigma factor [Acidimicrobiales bacterium]|nr:sigma-70 family RNA polymerase sigma factor [Acidimicrobiales bacterium]